MMVPSGNRRTSFQALGDNLDFEFPGKPAANSTRVKLICFKTIHGRCDYQGFGFVKMEK